MKLIFKGFRLPVAMAAGAGLLLSLSTGPAAWASPAEDMAAPADAAAPAQSQKQPTVEDARKFVEEANRRLLDLSIDAGRAAWVQATYITEDTEILSAQAGEKLTAETVRLAKEAAKFNGVKLPEDLARQIELIKLSLTLPAPSDPAKTSELSRLAASLESQYGSGEFCLDGKDGKPRFEDRTVVTFAEQAGKTAVTVAASILAVHDPTVADAITGMEEGWKETLDRLATYLATKR